MISFDIETLGVRSSAVILSVACVRFETSDVEKFAGQKLNDVYKDYLMNSLFVKFNVEEQIKMLKRTTDDKAIEWWKTQDMLVREKSFRINTTLDVKAKAGIDLVKQYCYFQDKEPVLWQRGGMDQICFDDMCKQLNIDTLPFWQWMDYRTACNLTKETAKRGYCDVPGFDRQLVVKHDPVHDAAYDIMMLLWGK